MINISFFIPHYNFIFYRLAALDGLCVLTFAILRFQDNNTIFHSKVETFRLLIFLFAVLKLVWFF
ncbi:hypothetical protein MOUN0_F03576 [Monosporozyma unispora]